MKDKQDFFGLLGELDGLDAAEYSRVLGDFDFGRYILRVNRVAMAEDPQGSLFLIRVPQQIAGFPHHLLSSPVRRTALEDYLIRQVSSALEQQARFDDDGLARRRISIAAPGQKILPRTALLITDDQVEARLIIQLPVREGRILARAAQDIFLHDLPRLVTDAMLYCNLDAAAVEDFVNQMEDADQVRQALPTRGLVAFVRDGSLLARTGGTDQPDLLHATPLAVTGSIRVELDTPNAGAVVGLGVPAGITVVVGDDASGRVELMHALAAGIYNHIPGDGREMAITLPDAVYVAAEPGRSVQRVDVSPFFARGEEGGPYRAYTACAATPAASQAAALVEAIEVGARALLFDESNAAPGFLALDQRLAALAGTGSVRTVPLAQRARQIADELGISLVIGGHATVGDFISVADHVLAVRDFEVRDITEEARKAVGTRTAAAGEAAEVAKLVERARWVVPGSLDASAGRLDVAVSAPAVSRLHFGRHCIDLSALQQLADPHQTATIGLILNYAKTRYMEEGRPLREILDLVDRDLSTEGLECLSRDLRGDLARPRRYEIAAALNRLRSLRISARAE